MQKMLGARIVKITGWTHRELDDADYDRLMEDVVVWGEDTAAEAEAMRGRGRPHAADD